MVREIVEEVRARVQEIMGDEYETYINEKQETNNGTVLQIGAKKIGTNIGPSLTIAQIWEDFDGEIDDVAHKVAEALEDAIRQCPIDDVDMLSDPDFIKQNCYFSLINAEKNEELGEQAVCEEFLDLLAVVRVKVSDGATYVLRNDMLDKIGLERSEVLTAARENTKKDMESVSVFDTLVQMGAPACFEMEDDGIMTVCSNKRKMHGAAFMMYTDLLAELAERKNSDLYILPSSIHEVLAIKADQCESEETLAEMVKDVNRTQVAPNEVLSDSVYLYSREDGTIRKVA